MLRNIIFPLRTITNRQNDHARCIIHCGLWRSPFRTYIIKIEHFTQFSYQCRHTPLKMLHLILLYTGRQADEPLTIHVPSVRPPRDDRKCVPKSGRIFSSQSTQKGKNNATTNYLKKNMQQHGWRCLYVYRHALNMKKYCKYSKI